MRAVLGRPAWWLCLVAVLLHQFLQYGLGWRLGWLDHYLDPFLFLPVLLGLWLAERRWLLGVPYRLSLLETVVAGSVLALVAEELLPRWEPRFVRDGWDYVAYAAGGVYFYFAVNPRKGAGVNG